VPGEDGENPQYGPIGVLTHPIPTQNAPGAQAESSVQLPPVVSTHSTEEQPLLHVVRHTPDPQLPQGANGPAALQSSGGVDVGVAVAVALGVGVSGGAQPEAVQASQQLVNCPTQAVPPRGATHLVASRLGRQLVLPAAVIRQHVTKPGLPQMERAAQRLT